MQTENDQPYLGSGLGMHMKEIKLNI